MSETSQTLASGHSEEDFADLFDNAPCGYISTDPRGRITKVNQTLARWLGVAKPKLEGQRFQDLLNIAGMIYYETHFAPLLRMQGFFNEVALDLVREGGQTFPALVNAVERRDEAGRPELIRITIFNASERRRYERELLTARRRADEATTSLRTLNRTLEQRVAREVAERMTAEESLRQMQKMEAIGQLTGGLAHDFNNLLTVIMGALEMIGAQVPALQHGPAADRIDRARGMANQAAERAATLTTRLLTFARRQPLNSNPVDIAYLVSGMAELLQRTLGETIRLKTTASAGLWRTLIDPTELENAIINLAVNARDAMADGGRLDIESTNTVFDEDSLATLSEPIPFGQYVLVAVTDTGEGMNSDTQARVFEPFFTTKEAGKGTGLGLSQVYGFVRQSCGHIRIDSEPGSGTTIRMYFPRHEAELASETKTTPVHQAPVRGGDETILVVEDHEDVRSYSADVLKELGYHVLAAHNGHEALRILEAETVDLLFTDVVLPEGLDGQRLADRAIERQPNLKVLYTTGYARNMADNDDQHGPALELVTKPFTSGTLGAKVRELLDH